MRHTTPTDAAGSRRRLALRGLLAMCASHGYDGGVAAAHPRVGSALCRAPANAGAQAPRLALTLFRRLAAVRDSTVCALLYCGARALKGTSGSSRFTPFFARYNSGVAGVVPRYTWATFQRPLFLRFLASSSQYF